VSDIDWDLITRYLGGACTPAERADVERWLAESPRHRMVAEELRAIGADGDAPAPPEWKTAVVAALRRRAAELAPVTRSDHSSRGSARRPARSPRLAVSSGPRISPWMKAAAAALLVAGGVVAGRAVLGPSGAPAAAERVARVYTAARGQRLSLRLPDGTAVALAPGSTLRVPASYGAVDRVVSLEGGAAFTVVHDSTRPFSAHTARAVAHDLGTRFVVRAYAGDSVTDVVVAEGRVAVGRAPTDSSAVPSNAPTRRPRTPSDGVVIERGERARLTPAGRLAVTRGVPLDPYFAWTEGRLVFEDTPLREAAAQLSRWYDVDIRLASDAIGARRLTAAVEDEPAQDVLPLIAATLKLTLTREGRVFTFGAQ